MAVTSGAMYNPRNVVPSFMSSNTYYGYVPPYRKENQLNGALEHAEVTETSMFDRCSYDTAMETDDDGCDYSVASRYLNNASVILAAPTQSRLKTNDQQQHREQQAAHGDADTLQRRNRKRCNGDLGPTAELKKFREGGGNYHAHCGTGNTKDYGLAKVSYESKLLHLNTIDKKCLEQSTIVKKGCCWAAGNHNLLNNSACNHLLSSNGFKLIESNAEYEKILFETHGCSIYHLHRLQLLDNDCTETEF